VARDRIDPLGGSLMADVPLLPDIRQQRQISKAREIAIGSAPSFEAQSYHLKKGRRLWAAAIDNHASGHLFFSRFLRVAQEAQWPPEDLGRVGEGGGSSELALLPDS
jgi:hypothetical protein